MDAFYKIDQIQDFFLQNTTYFIFIVVYNREVEVMKLGT